MKSFVLKWEREREKEPGGGEPWLITVTKNHKSHSHSTNFNNLTHFPWKPHMKFNILKSCFNVTVTIVRIVLLNDSNLYNIEIWSFYWTTFHLLWERLVCTFVKNESSPPKVSSELPIHKIKTLVVMTLEIHPLSIRHVLFHSLSNLNLLNIKHLHHEPTLV